KQLGQQKIDHDIPHEIENKLEEKFQHALLLHGHKKSGWRVRLPTTGLTRLEFPRVKQVQKLNWANQSQNQNQKQEHRQECLCYLGRKGAAAAAVSGGVGILENETLAHQRFFVFESCAVQIEKAFRVYEETSAEFFENFVA